MRKKRVTGTAASTHDLGTALGFAAFLDLRDSTYVWNQNPDLAEEALACLARTVERATQNWQGQIGNFTGDGFLVLFPIAEYAVRGLAAVIEEWESQRLKFCNALLLRGAQPPDANSLMVRTGIAHGHYRFFTLLTRDDVAGEAINRASRCESASKAFFELAQLESSLAQQQRVFVTQDVFSLIRNKTDYWYSEKLSVEFRGYERPSSSGLITTPDHIVAIWPKVAVHASEIPAGPTSNLRRASKAANRIDIADRLVAAAVSPPPKASPPSHRPNRDILLGAIMSYGEALQHLPEDDLHSQRADIHSKIGLAHVALADHVLSLQGRASRLNEALQQFRMALSIIRPEDSDESASINSNIAATRKRQAELVAPAERAQYLTEAVRALREVLRVPSHISDPRKYSIALSNLALALGSQAEFLADDEKFDKWQEVVDLLRKSLAVTSPSNSPDHYASVQSDLSNALRMQARQVDSRPVREALLTEGEELGRSALKQLDSKVAPSRYANAQINLGLLLLDKSQMSSRTEAMLQLAEGTDAFNEALKLNEAKEFSLKHAMVQEHLALSLQLQAKLLSGLDQERHLADARYAYDRAAKVYAEAGHTDSADRVRSALGNLPCPVVST